MRWWKKRSGKRKWKKKRSKRMMGKRRVEAKDKARHKGRDDAVNAL